MKKWLHRIRGVLGTAMTWAVAWSGVGAIVGLVTGVGSLGVGIAIYGIMGLVSGGAFSVILGITEGRRRFDEMSLPRFAFWGAVSVGLPLAGIMLSVRIVGDVTMLIAVMTLLGAGSAAGPLALARRSEDRELLEAGEEALGLAEGG